MVSGKQTAALLRSIWLPGCDFPLEAVAATSTAPTDSATCHPLTVDIDPLLRRDCLAHNGRSNDRNSDSDMGAPPVTPKGL